MKKTIFIITAILVFGLLIFLLSLLTNSKPKLTPDTARDTNYQITPSEVTQLTAGDSLIFNVSINPFDQNSIPTFSLTKTPLSDNQTINVPINVSTTQNGVIVTSTENIEPLTLYTLLFSDSYGNVFMEKQFASGPQNPPQATENNQGLRNFLPYDAQNYMLEYVEDTNTYVVHFRFNINAPGTIEEQFNQARIDANSYIQSLGFDPNTLTIEYSYN